MNPSLVPPDVNLRTLERGRAAGEGRFELNLYLRQRGDANIQSNTDLVKKANYYEDPNFSSQRQSRENADKPMELDTAARLQGRFAVQTMILQCMEELQLDALVYPTDLLPPAETANNNGRREAVRIAGPVPARLPVGMDIVARPFDEPTLLRIAAAFERGTRHREAPAGFGRVAGEP